MLNYREAIEYDLLKETGHELNDIGRTLSWGALDSFVRNSGPDSALMMKLNPDVAEWSRTLKTNAILADIADILMMINANLVSYATRKPAKRPKPYPRPGKEADKDERHFGSGGLPPAELRKWIERKRIEHARSSTGNISCHANS